MTFHDVQSEVRKLKKKNFLEYEAFSFKSDLLRIKFKMKKELNPFQN
jgi:hypothetical protein